MISMVSPPIKAKSLAHLIPSGLPTACLANDATEQPREDSDPES